MTTIHFFTPVQELITQVEERMRAQAGEQQPELDAALQHLLTSGGKRVRPAVALLTGTMLGAEPDRLVTLSAALELLHTATLVHDDLIDSSLLRRGIPTLNAHWSPAATVLTGDYIFARAAQLAAATNSVAVMNLFAETLAEIVSGEVTQLFSSRGLASRDNYYKRIYAKTASLFKAATGAAALLSEVDEEVVNAMYEFGESIGMAFQIVDDVLDFTAHTSDLGKPVASDLRQGLITLPALFYLEAHPDDPTMAMITQGNRINEEEMTRLVDAIRQSGSVRQAMSEARKFVEQGLEILRKLPATTERRALEELSAYIIERHY